MRVLLDTCVLAELRHPRGNSAVKAAVALVPDNDLFVSALTIADVAKGIALLLDGRKRRNLSTWLTTFESQFGDRVLPVDHATAFLWGNLFARAQQAGVVLPLVEGLLAATALRHGLHIMTRPNMYFAATGALIIDPWNDSERNDEAQRPARIE